VRLAQAGHCLEYMLELVGGRPYVLGDVALQSAHETLIVGVGKNVGIADGRCWVSPHP
jgi:hypothetical protein